MSCLDRSGLDYDVWRHGAAKCDFRGPAGDLSQPFVAVLGGCAAFGRFVEEPFACLLEDRLGEQVVNLSVMHAGVTLIRSEPEILGIAARADAVVVQVLGAQTMSNPFYSVHPRRNDRLISVSPRLRALFPQVDFMGLHFTGHLLRTLEAVDPWSFDTLLETLRTTWVETMQAILAAIPGPSVLLWMSDRGPGDPARGSAAPDPAFVDEEMLRALDGYHDGLVDVRSQGAPSGDRRFTGRDADIARLLPGPACHQAAAEALAPVLVRAKRTRRAGASDAPLQGHSADQSFSMSSGRAVKRSATSP